MLSGLDFMPFQEVKKGVFIQQVQTKSIQVSLSITTHSQYLQIAHTIYVFL